MRNYFVITLVMLVMAGSQVLLSSCSSDNEDTTPKVNYYGVSVPYTPLEENELPEWIKEMIKDKSMMGLERIYMGILNNQAVYHFIVGTDATIIGRFYDKDGVLINYSCPFEEFKAQIRDVKCIYYRLY